MTKEIILEKYSSIDGRSIYFEKYRADKLIKTVKVITLISVHNDFKYIVILDTYGETIFEVYKYLNDEIGIDKWKKREKAMQSLKLLFSFVELFNIKNYRSLKREDLTKFKAFLSGGIQKGNLLEFNCNTVRQSATINQYMSVYRDFYAYLGIEDSIFHDKKELKTVFKTSATSSGYTASVVQYNSNKRQPQVKRVPKYIKIDEYTEILSLIEDENSRYGLREQIIVRLMFEYGLRLSEVLGLTIEDVKPLVNEDSDRYGKIILRNRLSDKVYHTCKNLITPKHLTEYNSVEYKTEKIGFHSIIVTENIIDLINEYIDDTRDIFSMTPTAIKNISEAKADSVEDFELGENYYIFLNKNYKSLSKSGWNKILREIYETVGIELDKGVKRTNLSHRFRHGFAMMCIKGGVDRYTLKELMRHKNIGTVDIYFNPTVEDNIETAIQVSKIIQERIGINIERQINEIREVD